MKSLLLLALVLARTLVLGERIEAERIVVCVRHFKREQRRAIEVVTADGARWIGQLVVRRCPNARWVMDPFHVVQWMNDALDAVR